MTRAGRTFSFSEKGGRHRPPYWVRMVAGRDMNEQQSCAMGPNKSGVARFVRALKKRLVNTNKFYMHPWSLSVRAGIRWLNP
jgi:hypothetical protein